MLNALALELPAVSVALAALLRHPLWLVGRTCWLAGRRYIWGSRMGQLRLRLRRLTRGVVDFGFGCRLASRVMVEL